MLASWDQIIVGSDHAQACAHAGLPSRKQTQKWTCTALGEIWAHPIFNGWEGYDWRHPLKSSCGLSRGQDGAGARKRRCH